MKILVTGGSGMVGQNLLRHPAILQNNVLAPSRKILDLNDFPQTREYLAREKPDAVVHCAGRVGGIQANIDAPLDFLTDNLEMGKNLVLAARETGIPRLMNLGSSCMYPRDIDGAISESDLLSGVLEPTNEGYALAKIVVAKLCEYVSRTQQELAYKTVIPCNLYGRYDKFDPDKSHFIAAIISKIHRAMENDQPVVEIWGEGKARREVMYAEDLADFIAYALHRFEEMPALLNVGVGYDHSINEYYKEIANIIGFRGEFVHDTSRKEGMQRKLTDISKLTEFGWRAKTDLPSGIALACQYYRELLKRD